MFGPLQLEIGWAFDDKQCTGEKLQLDDPRAQAQSFSRPQFGTDRRRLAFPFNPYGTGQDSHTLRSDVIFNVFIVLDYWFSLAYQIKRAQTEADQYCGGCGQQPLPCFDRQPGKQTRKASPSRSTILRSERDCASVRPATARQFALEVAQSRAQIHVFEVIFPCLRVCR